MELLAPDNLPGVGMGDLGSIGGIGGLVGLAVTSGALLATGLPGAIAYVVAAVLVLMANDERWGDQPLAAGVVLAVVLLLGAGRSVAGSRLSAWIGAAVAGAAVGYAWAEWNEGAFGSPDGEAAVGIAIGVVAALVGAWAADLFVTGSVRAGGSLAIVGTAVALALLVLNSASFYVPFVGFLALLLLLLVPLRLRRRDKEKYKGLRILS